MPRETIHQKLNAAKFYDFIPCSTDTDTAGSRHKDTRTYRYVLNDTFSPIILNI